MKTPEAKVKDKVKRVLDEFGAYYFMPATHGYGSSGVPDIFAVLHGRSFGIECKADGKRVTELQMANLNALVSHGGFAFVVDGRGVGVFKMWVADFTANPQKHSSFGAFIDLIN